MCSSDLEGACVFDKLILAISKASWAAFLSNNAFETIWDWLFTSACAAFFSCNAVASVATAVS